MTLRVCVSTHEQIVLSLANSVRDIQVSAFKGRVKFKILAPCLFVHDGRVHTDEVSHGLYAIARKLDKVNRNPEIVRFKAIFEDLVRILLV